LEALDTNEASVLRLSLHHLGSFKFKSLIGRFRITYTEDNRIRELLLPAQTKVWSSVGPFPAEDVTKAFTTVFEPEKDIKNEPLDLKKSYAKVVLPPSQPAKTAGAKSAPAAKPGDGAKPAEAPNAAPAAAKPETDKSQGKRASQEGADKAKPAKPEKTDSKNAANEPAKSEAPKAKETETSSSPKPKPKPEQITWTEQRKWRDGSPAQLSGANSAYYLTRKIVSTRPRTALIQIDGAAGFRMWLNGEVVHTSAPPSPPPPPKTDGKPAGGDKDAEGKTDAKADDDKEEPPGPDFDNIDDIADMTGRGRSKTEVKFRIGLRQGENEIVLKSVYGSGGGPQNRPKFFLGGGRPNAGDSLVFNLIPEGDDVLTHEVVMALRLEELERSKSAVPVPVADAKAKPSAGTGTPVNPVKGTSLAIRDRSDSKNGPNTNGLREGASTSKAARPLGAATTAGGIIPAMNTVEEKKVSLVGEKSAPLKSYEEENKLSPSERRRKVLREYYRSHIDPIGRVIAEELAKLKEEEKQLKREMPQTLVMEELEKPRQAYIFKRGLYKNRGDNVAAATPAVLPPMAKELPRNRLGLAKWLVSGQHPLTARVLVNRIWKQYFGVGIVRTAEDFGIRAELPTHPELLDYLATELVSSKWDLKKLHKRIVLSATYRQAARAAREKLERDPENRLLARGPRLRLSAEMIRDAALAVSGLLQEKIGGESVKPFQPKNAWKTVEGNMASLYRRDRDEKQYRRALYVYWKRGSPYPSMLNFDAVKRDSCTVTRAATTTPLQALTLLNDPAYVECAKMLGQRMLKHPEVLGRNRDLKKSEEDARRLAYGFRLCTSRAPTTQEIEMLRKLLDDQRAHFKADAKAATKLLHVGDAKIDEALGAGEAAAWACIGNALLNLDVTIHR
jgi:hypothetical protein